MKLWPTSVNLTKVILCTFRSSSDSKRSMRYLLMTSSSTSSAFMDMMQRSHLGSVTLQPLVRLWKLCVPRQKVTKWLSFATSSSFSSSLRILSFLKSSWLRKSLRGAMQLQTLEQASCLISKPLPNFLIAKMRMSKGSSALISLAAFSKSTSRFSRSMRYLSSNSRLAEMPLQSACTFLSVLPARDHLILLRLFMLVLRMKPWSQRILWMMFSMVFSVSLWYCSPKNFSPLQPKKMPTLILRLLLDLDSCSSFPSFSSCTSFTSLPSCPSFTSCSSFSMQKKYC